MSPSQRAGLTQKLKQVSGHVADRLREQGAPAVLIGGRALGVHGYPRHTKDLDLMTTCSLDTLHRVSDILKADGFRVEIRDPGPPGQDDLSGVIDLRVGRVGLVQIVNLRSRLGHGAIETAIESEGLPFRVVDLPHLIALKLDAGSFRDRADVVELLVRNRSADRGQIRTVCEQFKVSKRFDRLVAEMETPPGDKDE